MARHRARASRHSRQVPLRRAFICVPPPQCAIPHGRSQHSRGGRLRAATRRLSPCASRLTSYDYFCGTRRSERNAPLLERLMQGYGENVPASPLPVRRHTHSQLPPEVLSGELLHPHAVRAPLGPSAPRRRGRPRKSAPPSWLPVQPSTPSDARADADPPTKRPRGRPRKYPLPGVDDPQPLEPPAAPSANWTRTSATDRPPRFPETHVLITQPAPPPPAPWQSPERPSPRPPGWVHYLRPVVPSGLRHTEPVTGGPRAPTRQDYVALRHWHLVCMARGRQLDVRRLWEVWAAKRRSRPRAASEPPAQRQPKRRRAYTL